MKSPLLKRTASTYSSYDSAEELLPESTPFKRASSDLGESYIAAKALKKPKYISPEGQLSKKGIIHLFRGVMHEDVSQYVLTDIRFGNENNVTVLGRCKIKGTSNQLCHVIPVSFIKEMVKSLVKEAANPRLLTEKLSLVLSNVAKMQSGFAVKSDDLALPEYSSIASMIPKSANRALKTEGTTVFLMSPSKKDTLFPTPTKSQKASEEYQKYNPKFIKNALAKLGEIIKDDNTAIIVSELLARYIFGLPNSGKNTVFAKEGNTSRYEIRLYDDKETAALGGDGFKVMTAKELKAINPEALGGAIRIVDSEGASVKACINALRQLKAISNDTDDNIKVTVYNDKYNKHIKLANYLMDLSDYNDSIICDENIENQIAVHIAKNLYLAFDLTALEKIVFVPVTDGNIPVYVGAIGARIVNYGFTVGDTYRKSKMNETHYSDDRFFRSTEKDREILPQKLVELFLIGTSPFASYDSTHPIFLDVCLSKLIELASKDYCMKKEENTQFKSKVLKIYQALKCSSKTSDAESAEVVVLGEAFESCNQMLGNASDMSDLFS